MDLHDSWFYIHILNSTWFLWTLVVLVLGGNVLAPILIWLIMSSTPLIKKKHRGGQRS